MPLKVISIKYQNGIDKQIAEKEILNELLDDFVFEESNNPDFIIFGPYGADIPQPGPYVRIGYFCENIKPDLAICEWAFGIPTEKKINNPRYKRIQWHNLNPVDLVKRDTDAEKIYASKNKFCNFFYSNPVTYRENFFKQLSNYKKIDAPGKRMNNMSSIDDLFSGDKWEIKRQFLSPYKFTIAFENYVYPGYQTEKLYDAMRVNSIPIYCGDPDIGKIFNTKAFINVADYIKTDNATSNWLENTSQSDFIDILPQYYHNPFHRFKRKLKSIGRSMKMKMQFSDLDFKPVIDRIIELDQDKNKYLEMINEPWFIDNKPPGDASSKQRWVEIFNSANTCK